MLTTARRPQLGSLLFATTIFVAAGACSFHDDGIRYLIVACAGYSVNLLRTNGALTGIYTAGGDVVSRGSLNGCLFGFVGPNNTYCGACSCVGGAPTMSVTWDNTTFTLALTFTSRAAAEPSSAVLLTAYDGAPYFDLTYRLLAAPTSGAGFTSLLFPSSIRFDTTGMTALHAPLLPGVALGPGFFERRISTSWYYPGRCVLLPRGDGARRAQCAPPWTWAACSGGFAGWTHLDTANGSLAIYDLSGPDFVAPYLTIPTPTTGPSYAPSDWYLDVYHPVNVTAACTPSPMPNRPFCALGANGSLARRFHVSSGSTRASALTTMAAYVAHNGMVAGAITAATGGWSSPPFPTLREKLESAPGGGPDFWRQVYEAPLLKLDAVAVGLPYANYSSQVSRSRISGHAMEVITPGSQALRRFTRVSQFRA